MPEKHFYFAMGATTGGILAVLLRTFRRRLYEKNLWMRKLYQWDRDWFIYLLPALVWSMGLLALAPDFLYVTGILPKAVTRAPLFNLFFGHSFFERLEHQNLRVDRWLNWCGGVLALVAFVGLIGCLAYSTHRIRKD